MKKVISLLFIFVLMVTICLLVWKLNVSKKINTEEEWVDRDSVTYNGWLSVKGADIVNEKDENIQLRGVSSHGIQWFYDVVTYENLKTLKEDWNCNAFRIAMYTNPDDNGYISNPEKMTEKVCNIVDMAVDLDMYVIVDWHILNDKNPMTYQSEAESFFSVISEKYKDVPNVIYEICNEPNGSDSKWGEVIKPYAQSVTSTIRKNSPKSLIIVGTPRWSSDIYSVVGDTLDMDNIAYACHFYAGSHGDGLRNDIRMLREKNIPIFVSECGITDATGAGKIYEDSFLEWVKFLDENNISYIFWSFSNKDEESSILSPEYTVSLDQSMNDYLSQTGEIVKKVMRKDM